VLLGRIHRMILIELFKVFALSLIALTGLVLLAGVMAEAMKSGLGPAQILVVVPLLLPSLLPYTVPTTTLFATCLVYGRLAADNEILALKAAGTHVLHVVWPAVLLGLLTSAGTMFLSLDFIPYTHFVMRTQINADVEELLYGLLRRDGCLRDPRRTYEIHVKSIDGRTLHGVVFKQQARKEGGCDVIACAKEADLSVDLARRQVLVNMRNCQIVEGNMLGYVEEQTFLMAIPGDWGGAGAKLRSTDMAWSELSDYEAKFRAEKQQLSAEIDKHQKQLDLGRGGARFAEHIKHLTNERRIRANYIDAIQSEFHMRPALALGCLCFALIGCPVGIWFGRSDYLSAFVTCFLPVVTIYYPLLFCFINLARVGKMPPWLGIYDADGLLILAGIVLIRRLARN